MNHIDQVQLNWYCQELESLGGLVQPICSYMAKEAQGSEEQDT